MERFYTRRPPYPLRILSKSCPERYCWGPKFHKKAHSMKSKERLWVLTKEGLIYIVKKEHLGPKSQKEGKKERNNNNNNNKEKKKRISVRPEDMQQGSRPEDIQ